MNHGARADVALTNLDDAELCPFEVNHALGHRLGQDRGLDGCLAEHRRPPSGLILERVLDVLDDPGRSERPRTGEPLEQRSDSQIVICVAVGHIDGRQLAPGLLDQVSQGRDVGVDVLRVDEN